MGQLLTLTALACNLGDDNTRSTSKVSYEMRQFFWWTIRDGKDGNVFSFFPYRITDDIDLVLDNEQVMHLYCISIAGIIMIAQWISSNRIFIITNVALTLVFELFPRIILIPSGSREEPKRYTRTNYQDTLIVLINSPQKRTNANIHTSYFHKYTKQDSYVWLV